MRIAFDIDGTICNNTDGKYEDAEPYKDMVDLINNLHDKGNYIIIHTARGMGRYRGVKEDIIANLYGMTEQQLKTWGVKYHELHLCKIHADLYVDDKGFRVKDDGGSAGDLREMLNRRDVTKESKILFINPSSINKDALPIPPLGILYVASFLRENGYTDIEVIDNNVSKLNHVDLGNTINKYDIICVTGTTSQYPEAAVISGLAKKYSKISVAGGPHASSVPEDMINAGFDFVVVGEGEIAMLDLLQAIGNSSDPADVRGIVFKKDLDVIKTKKRKYIKNLETLPFPARDLVDMSLYGNKELKRFGGKYTHMMSSRGCGNKCTFCCSPIMWQCCRLSPAHRVFEEMMDIYNRYGIKNIHFQDDNFTIHKQRVLDICDLIISSGIDFEWSCQTRPTAIDYEVIMKMKAAGCVQVEFGVESGDEEILSNSNKKYTTKQIKQGFDLARQAGIRTYGFFIVGLPGESITSWVKSIIFAKTLKLDSSVWTVLIPYPGTEIYNSGLVKILDHDYANWLYKKPIIRSGMFGPWALSLMRWLADKIVNGFFNSGAYK